MLFFFHFAFSILPFPFFIEISQSSPHPDGHVRAHFSAKSASRAGLLVVPAGEEESQTVHLLPNSNQLFRAGDRAKSAAFTSLTVDFNLCHGERAFHPCMDEGSMI